MSRREAEKHCCKSDSELFRNTTYFHILNMHFELHNDWRECIHGRTETTCLRPANSRFGDFDIATRYMHTYGTEQCSTELFSTFLFVFYMPYTEMHGDEVQHSGTAEDRLYASFRPSHHVCNPQVANSGSGRKSGDSEKS